MPSPRRSTTFLRIGKVSINPTHMKNKKGCRSTPLRSLEGIQPSQLVKDDIIVLRQFTWRDRQPFIVLQPVGNIIRVFQERRKADEYHVLHQRNLEGALVDVLIPVCIGVDHLDFVPLSDDKSFITNPGGHLDELTFLSNLNIGKLQGLKL